MRLLFPLTLLTACSLNNEITTVTEDPLPDVVDKEISYEDEEAERVDSVPSEFARIAANERLEAILKPLEAMASARFPHEYSAAFLVTNTDSNGTNLWRSCARLTVDRFGLPKDTLAVTYTRDMIACENRPDDVAFGMIIIGPLGFENTIALNTYEGEEGINATILGVAVMHPLAHVNTAEHALNVDEF